MREVQKKVLISLSEDASRIQSGGSSVLALHWFDGRRTPAANQHLKSVIGGLTLGSDAPSVYRALVEATAFGSRSVVERFRREGRRLDNVIAVGGIATRLPLAVQILTDVLSTSITVCKSEQVCALGSAIAAAAAAGCHKSISAAQEMARGSSTASKPCP
ncbi:hypothetical protein CUR178_00004 [Leishmania enriettii]|uniref:Carbohydrate kinase FGGY C-terminal domain-containing protein n=1 Tax=Leishmania enriettii TaxID=5663 RepID=A0A836KC15_LEIEN|nr:hypothetical protein CUR178_00004 [Leishmania enriettii]